ncbi:MAG: hypothetical protein O2968_12550 [Acidobacteria bacterium]|nr:hypothetical protein [Acidobacteriota bacterium]
MDVAGRAMQSMRIFIPVVFSALWLLPAASAGVREDFETTAKKLSLFALDDFLYDRELLAQVGLAEANKYNEIIARLIHGEVRVPAEGIALLAANRVTTAEVSPLLRHDDPKVRTLAMAWLFANDGQAALPLLVELIDDPAETFPAPLLTSAMYLPGQERPSPPLQDQTVGGVARAMLAFYMKRAGYYYGVEGRGENPGFAEYWDRRGNRDHCLSWFAVQLDRSTHGVSPLRQQSRSGVFVVRREIDRLPPIEREVALLGLFGDKNELRELVTEQDLVFAGRRLGAERLLTLLRGEPLTDDTDLPHFSDGIRSFVLSNAPELLRSADGAWLLQRGRETRQTDWFLAAAEVQPEAASVVLREAFKTADFLWDERTRTATALWRLASEGNEDYLIDWFFRDSEPKMGHAPYRAGFVDFLAERFTAADRSLLARLVRDTRFEQLDWGTLESLINGLNRNVLHPIVPSNQLNSTRHPLGKSHVHGMMERARQEYPGETSQLLKTLAGWRERIRARLSDWEPAPE